MWTNCMIVWSNLLEWSLHYLLINQQILNSLTQLIFSVVQSESCVRVWYVGDTHQGFDFTADCQFQEWCRSERCNERPLTFSVGIWLFDCPFPGYSSLHSLYGNLVFVLKIITGIVDVLTQSSVHKAAQSVIKYDNYPLINYTYAALAKLCQFMLRISKVLHHLRG